MRELRLEGDKVTISGFVVATINPNAPSVARGMFEQLVRDNERPWVRVKP